MKTITFEIPEDIAFGTKVSGEFLPIAIDTMDDSWLAEMLRYGCQRKINDMFAGQGDDKLAMARAQVAEINNGEVKSVAVRRTGGATTDPARKMARTMARELLTIAFKKATGMVTVADMCKANGKVAAYFHITSEGKATWNAQAIDKFMATLPSGRDFMAEAKASLSVELDLGF